MRGSFMFQLMINYLLLALLNGSLYYYSRAIMAYLVSKYAKNDSLYPKDPKEKAMVDQMMYFDAGSIYPNIFKCYVRIDVRSDIFQIAIYKLGRSPQYLTAIFNK